MKQQKLAHSPSIFTQQEEKELCRIWIIVTRPTQENLVLLRAVSGSSSTFQFCFLFSRKELQASSNDSKDVFSP